MNKILLISMCILLSGAFMTPEASQLSFENGVRLYEAGAYLDALEEWKKLESNDIISRELYKNIAASHYRLGDYPLAILYYERALKLSPGNKTINQDLELARSAIPGLKQKLPSFVLWAFWLKFTSLISEAAWMWVSFLLAVFGLVGLWLWLFKKSETRAITLRIVMIATGVAYIISMLALYTRHTIRNDNSNFILTKEKTSLKAGPDAQSPEIEIIPLGESLRLIDKIGDWYEVVLPDGSSGWVRADLLTPV